MPENENITTYPEEPTNPSGYEGFNKSVYYILSLLRYMYYSKVESENKFYTKNGGTITGSVTIQGNLVVNGQSYSIDTENLKVGDYTITLAKDNEQTLTSMVGMVVPKYDGTNYGFFGWDADGYAYVGDLTNYDGTSAITLANNSSLQRISTIDTTNTVVASNGVIYVYDATSHCFKKPTNDNKYYVIRNGAFVETELFTEQKSKNISNALYNLGAFDTISGNTITRQTGYAYGKDYMDKTILRNSANNPYINTYISVNALDKFVGNCPKVDSNSWWSATFTTPTLTYDSNGNTLIVMLPNGATDTSALQDIQIQYKLATSYQDNIIPNQPLLNLDSNGCNFLREEWEKGLNLFDNDYYLTTKTFTTSGNHQTQFAFYLANTWDGTSNYVARFTYGGTGAGFETELTQTISTSGDYYVIYGYRGDMQDNFNYTNKKIHIDAGTYTFNPTFSTFTTNNIVLTNIMLNKGTTPEPYQEWNGAIVHTKDIEPVLLWENSSPNSDFASQTITTGDMSGFKYIVIEYQFYKGNTLPVFLKTRMKYNMTTYLTTSESYATEAILYSRGFIYKTSTTIEFKDAYYRASNPVLDNSRNIPIAIYGTNVL